MAGILRRREGREGQPTENREMTRQTQGSDPFQWLASWDPFRAFQSTDPFRRMREMMNMDPFGETSNNLLTLNRQFMPKLEVCEKNDSYVICADLPGLTENDVSVEVTGNRLDISGKREEEERNESDRYWAYERSYGSFTRSFMLPEGTQPDEIDARLENGVLEVRIPKTKKEEATKIQIKANSPSQPETRNPPAGIRSQSQGVSTSGTGTGSTQTGTMGSTGQESTQGGAREKAA